MSLVLCSENTLLGNELKKIQSDNSVSISEFQHVRECADKELNELQFEKIKEKLLTFQQRADELVEDLQQVALSARKEKYSHDEREKIMSAVEYQIAYVFIGYKSSVGRLTLNHL